MPLNSVYRVRTRGRLRGQRVEFGVHIQWVSGSGGPDDLAGSWTATIMPLVLAATSTACNFDEVVVTDVSPDGDESFVMPLTQPNPGLLTGDALPGQNAMLVQLRTGQKGRRRHGRFFLPGLTEQYHTDGQVTGTQLTAVQALAAGILNTYGPTGVESSYRLVVYSPPSPEYKPPKIPKVRTDTIITIVRTFLVDGYVRTQRRRSIGTGE